MPAILIAKFVGDVDELKAVYDRGHALIMERGGAVPFGELFHLAMPPASSGPSCWPAWMLNRWVIRSWTGRVLLWTGAALLIWLVGFSRVYLGVHYPSDVAAGWVLGAVWASTVALACGWWEARGGATTPEGGQCTLDDPSGCVLRSPISAGSRPQAG